MASYGIDGKRHSEQQHPQSMGSSSPLNASTPPAYGAYTQSYANPPPTVLVQPVVIVKRERPPAGRRFCFALLFAIGGWFFIGYFIRSFSEFAGWYHHRHHWDNLPAGDKAFPIPDDITRLHECVGSTDWKHSDTWNSYYPKSSETTFKVPANADNLYVLSRGGRSGGALEVLTSPDVPKGTAVVRVVVFYHLEYVRDKIARVCRIDRQGDDKHGVGIFTPRWNDDHGNHREDRLQFKTTITLSEDQRGAIDGLETDLVNTSHFVGLGKAIPFETIKLTGSNGAIVVEALTSESIQLHTSNGGVKGTFNTTEELQIVTSNGGVDVNVGLKNEKKGDHTVTAKITTSNGSINAKVGLESSAGPGNFNVTTDTSNSPLFVKFTSQPLDSILTYKGATSNSPATVALAPAFEGKFSFSTSNWFTARLEQDDKVEDPSGAGRNRRVYAARVRSPTISGEVGWGDHVGKSSAEFETSNSRITLSL